MSEIAEEVNDKTAKRSEKLGVVWDIKTLTSTV